MGVDRKFSTQSDDFAEFGRCYVHYNDKDGRQWSSGAYDDSWLKWVNTIAFDKCYAC